MLIINLNSFFFLGSPDNSSSQLFSPFGVTRNSNFGTIYIADSGNHKILSYSPGATSRVVVAGNINGTKGNSLGSFYSPTNMIFDVLGNMYVADDRNYRIESFPFGELKEITVAGETDVFGQDNEHLYYSSSMAVDNQLNLYVADQYNHRRQLLESY